MILYSVINKPLLSSRCVSFFTLIFWLIIYLLLCYLFIYSSAPRCRRDQNISGPAQAPSLIRLCGSGLSHTHTHLFPKNSGVCVCTPCLICRFIQKFLMSVALSWAVWEGGVTWGACCPGGVASAFYRQPPKRGGAQGGWAGGTPRGGGWGSRIASGEPSGLVFCHSWYTHRSVRGGVWGSGGKV